MQKVYLEVLKNIKNVKYNENDDECHYNGNDKSSNKDSKQAAKRIKSTS